MSTIQITLAALLALTLAGDALLSLRPPAFIADCLDGVGFPRDWWWSLILVKLLAAGGIAAGLILGDASLLAAAVAGVVAYFIAAAIAHLRAGFLGSAFWGNCLGMLVFALVTLGVVLAG